MENPIKINIVGGNALSNIFGKDRIFDSALAVADLKTILINGYASDLIAKFIKGWYSQIDSISYDPAIGRPNRSGKDYDPSKPATQTTSQPSPFDGVTKHNIDTELERLVSLFSQWMGGGFSQRQLDTALRFDKIEDAQEYYFRYFETQCFPEKELDAIRTSVTSSEFRKAWSYLHPLYMFLAPEPINKRLEIYYGTQGTGKTTFVKTKYPDAVLVKCHPEMLSVDLLKSFQGTDENGHPVFSDSNLLKTAEGKHPSGSKTLIADEGGQVSPSALLVFQAFTDGLKEIYFEGIDRPIIIDDDFKLIITMNLKVGYDCHPLPAPLVDRAAILNKFECSISELAKRMFPNYDTLK